MKRVFAIVFFTLVIALPNLSVSGILFYDDCEDYPSITDKGGTDWGLTESRDGKLTVSTAKKRAGSKSYKMSFKATPEGVGQRVELILRAPNLKNFAFDKEYWIAWSMYVPSDFIKPSWGVLGQWHKAGQDRDGNCDQLPRPENSAVAQPIMNFLSGTDDKPVMKVQITGQSDFCQPRGYDYKKQFLSPALKKGAWNDIVIHKKFSYSKKGISRMWLNGEKFIDIKEINAHNDPKSPYLKLGFYASSKHDHTVYYDEIRIGDANSSYAEVSPKSGAKIPPSTEEPPEPKEKFLEPPILKIIASN